MKRNMKNLKKVIAIVGSFCMLLSTASVPVNAEDNTHLDLFVENGAAGGNGTKDTPFATIEEVRDYIRQIK